MYACADLWKKMITSLVTNNNIVNYNSTLTIIIVIIICSIIIANNYFTYFFSSSLLFALSPLDLKKSRMASPYDNVNIDVDDGNDGDDDYND